MDRGFPGCRCLVTEPAVRVIGHLAGIKRIAQCLETHRERADAGNPQAPLSRTLSKSKMLPFFPYVNPSVSKQRASDAHGFTPGEGLPSTEKLSDLLTSYSQVDFTQQRLYR